MLAFNRDSPELTLTEVSERVGVNAAATRRSLLTLEKLGYVTRHGRRFLLTPRVLRLSDAFLSSMGVQEVVQQYLQEISDATGDSASLGVLDGSEVLYIATVPVKRSFQLTPATGTRYPAYCSSMGRVLLAYSGEETVGPALDPAGLEKLTANTEVSPIALRKVLAAVRSVGIAGVQEEVAYGVVSVAVPILAADGRAIAAINCSTSPERTSAPAMIETRRDALMRGRSQIQNALKRHPPLIHAIEGTR